MNDTPETDAQPLWHGEPAIGIEFCRRMERQRDLLRDELMRVRDVVGEVDAELIDAVLEHTANAAVEARRNAVASDGLLAEQSKEETR